MRRPSATSCGWLPPLSPPIRRWSRFDRKNYFYADLCGPVPAGSSKVPPSFACARLGDGSQHDIMEYRAKRRPARARTDRDRENEGDLLQRIGIFDDA